MEGILGKGSRIVQPPLSMRPSALRKSKSQDTDDRRPIETALTTEGVHREIKIDDSLHRVPQSIDEMATAKPGFREAVVGHKPATKGPITSSPVAPQPVGLTDAKVIHDNMSYRPTPSQPIAIPTVPVTSAPTTPTIGKGHAHDPLEDTLFLNIGTGEDYSEQPTDFPVVSESPSNVDINVYEAAYQEEIQRIIDRNNEPRGRRPTLYLTRRVDHVKSLRDSELIVDGGRTRDELKASIKTVLKKAQKGVEERAELQRLEGKEDLLSKGWRNVREFKELVDEAREIVREEERRERAERGESSRSGTPVGKGTGSRSGTPVTATSSSSFSKV